MHYKLDPLDLRNANYSSKIENREDNHTFEKAMWNMVTRDMVINRRKDRVKKTIEQILLDK